MKRSNRFWSVCALVLTLALLCGVAINAAAGTGTIPQEEIESLIGTTTDASAVTSPMIEVANGAKKSVVGVNNYQVMTSSIYGYGSRNRSTTTTETLVGTGSGVVISKYGHVLTNYHVIESAVSVRVTTDAGDEIDAEVVASDEDKDIAVLLVPGLDLEPVPLGDSDSLQVGEWAIVIGNPLGEDFARSVTVGVVSALDREVTDSAYDRYGRRTTIKNSMIQVDAAINSGNSGGGLFNVLGQLQGIPARKYASNSFFSTTTVDNIGLCIPINVAKPLIQEALEAYNADDVASKVAEKEQKEQEQAKLQNGLSGKPRLGVSVVSLTESNNAVQQHILPAGSWITVVEDGSPAKEAGLQVDDIVVEIDGEIIRSSTDMISKIGTYNEGDTLKIKVYRIPGLSQAEYVSDIGEGEYVDVEVTLRMIDEVGM